MNVAELLVQPEKKTFLQMPSIIKQIRFGWRIMWQLLQWRNDTKMLAWFSKIQIGLWDKEIFELSRRSLTTEDDIEALTEYLVPLYRSGISARYDALLWQAVSEDITWFIHPLFNQVWLKFWNVPDRTISIFQEGVQILNLLGKDTYFNQMHEMDSPIFLAEDKIEATEELKKAKIGKVWWCPLMRVKSVVHWTLMTDFMITCVKFWTYRKVLQAKTIQQPKTGGWS